MLISERYHLGSYFRAHVKMTTNHVFSFAEGCLAAYFSDDTDKWDNGSVLRVDIDGINPDTGCVDPHYDDFGLTRRLLYGEPPGDSTAPERFSPDRSVQDTVSHDGLNFFVLEENATSASNRIVRLTLVIKSTYKYSPISEPIVIFQGRINQLGNLSRFKGNGQLPHDTTLVHRSAAVADVDTFVRRAAQGVSLRGVYLVYRVLTDIVWSRRFLEEDAEFIKQQINEKLAGRATREPLLDLVSPGGKFSPEALRQSTRNRSKKRPTVFKLNVPWTRVSELCVDTVQDEAWRTHRESVFKTHNLAAVAHKLASVSRDFIKCT